MEESSDYTLIRSGELMPRPSGSVAFEGQEFGSDVSLFLTKYEGLSGPVLHKHPYAETWIVRKGNARFTVDGEEIEAGKGDIVVVRKEAPHKFTNIGPDPLDIICIHPSSQFIQEDLE